MMETIMIMTRLPYSVKRGESFPLNVSVFTYIDVSHVGTQACCEEHFHSTKTFILAGSTSH